VKILVDADSCPREVRETVIRAAVRTGTQVIFAANRPPPGIATGGLVTMELCPPGEDSADNRIAALASPGDLVLTRDVPLASRLVAASVSVIDDRGGAYTADNIRERLSLRDFMVDLAESGLGAERRRVYGRKELQTFAGSFDRTLTRLLRKESAQGNGSK
jgi:uncharacterized protein YaiI (UPF0178 family)